MRLALLTTLVLATVANAAPPTAPREVSTKPASLVKIPVKSEGELTVVKSFTEEEALFGELVTGGKGERLFIFQPLESSTKTVYSVAFFDGKEGTITMIFVGGGPPNPGPQPDVELRRRLAEAVKSDAGRPEDVRQLAALYHQAAKLADPELTKDPLSGKELIRRVREASVSLLESDEKLSGVRTIVAGELLAVLGMSGDEPIPEAKRKAAADLFRRLAAALEEIAK